MPSDLDLLAEKVAQLLKPKSTRPDPRRNVNIRVDQQEMDLIDAAARDRNLCRSDFIRMALNAVLPQALRTDRPIPPGLRRFRVQHKTEHFNDGQTDHARNAAARAVRLRLEASGIMRALGSAQDGPQMSGQLPSLAFSESPSASLTDGKIGDAGVSRLAKRTVVPKPRP